MKTFYDKIFEAKFSKFTDEEKKAMKDQLDYYLELEKKDAGFKEIIEKSWIPISSERKFEYGEKYLVIIDNPLIDKNKAVKDCQNLGGKVDFEGKLKPLETPTKDNKQVKCIAVADKYGQLHLINQWEDDKCMITYKPRGMYWVSGKSKIFQDKGWFLVYKGLPSYPVQVKAFKRGESPWPHIHSEKQDDTVARLEHFVCLNISKLPAEIEKANETIQKRIETAKADEKARIEREKKEAERQKWWNDRKDYINFGYANGWDKQYKDTGGVPPLVKKAWADKNSVWIPFKAGRCISGYVNDTYKFIYSMDSSD